MKKHVPAILGSCLILAVCGFWLARVLQGLGWSSGAGVWTNNGFCLIYVAWMVLELRVSLREQAHEYADYGTRELYGACQSATILCALWFAAPERRPPALAMAGFFLFMAGIVYRTWAIHTLGVYYSHSVRTLKAHRIVDAGPYRLLRHPAYAGMLLTHAGVVVFFFSVPALAAYLAGLVPAVVLRILVEERALMGVEGYAAFAATRKRLVPGIW